MSTSQPELSGAFRLRPGTTTWTWSRETYVVYGFAPGGVPPSTEQLLAAQHPEDRADVAGFLEGVLVDGGIRSLWHRILGSRGTVRHVMTTAVVDLCADGRPNAARGHVVDVTEAVRAATAQEVDKAMESLARTRPPIEQAKGALMAAYALDADQAFGVLRGYSQLCNVKVRDVARDIVAALAREQELAPASRRLFERLAAQARSATGTPRDGG